MSVGRQVRTHLEQIVFSPQDWNNPFWKSVYDRFGAGRGYRIDVRSMYEAQIDYEDTADQFRHIATEEWSKGFIDRIVAFFG